MFDELGTVCRWTYRWSHNVKSRSGVGAAAPPGVVLCVRVMGDQMWMINRDSHLLCVMCGTVTHSLRPWGTSIRPARTATRRVSQRTPRLWARPLLLCIYKCARCSLFIAVYTHPLSLCSASSRSLRTQRTNTSTEKLFWSWLFEVADGLTSYFEGKLAKLNFLYKDHLQITY